MNLLQLSVISRERNADGIRSIREYFDNSNACSDLKERKQLIREKVDSAVSRFSEGGARFVWSGNVDDRAEALRRNCSEVIIACARVEIDVLGRKQTLENARANP
jgi:hypothetical protein